MYIKITAIFLIFVSLNSKGQNSDNFSNQSFVESYYNNELDQPIMVYDSIGGNRLKKLPSLRENYCWYKFAISSSKNGWFEIENLMVLPGCKENEINNNIEKYKGCWINTNELIIDTPDIDVDKNKGINFFKYPDSSSKIVFKTGVFLKTKLLEIKGSWAKVQFNNGEEVVEGWLRREDQCAYPWTSCSKY